MSLIEQWDAIPTTKNAANDVLAQWDALPTTMPKTTNKSDGKGSKSMSAVDLALLPATGQVGIAENIANIGTGMIAKPISDIAGLAAMGANIFGGMEGDPAAFKQHVQESLTYSPRTAVGQTITESPANPVNIIGNAIGSVSEGAGNLVRGSQPGPVRQAAGDALQEAIPQALGIAGAKFGSKVKGPTSIEKPASGVPNLKAMADNPAQEAITVESKPTSSVTGKAVDVPLPKEASPPKFAEYVPPPETGPSLPTAEQAKRVQLLKRIGFTEVRDSAIKGDMKAAATDYHASKVDRPDGDYLRSVLDDERQTLSNYAEKIVRDTGGTMGTDTSTLYSRGGTILNPLEGLKEWYTNKTRGLYKEAAERAQGSVVALEGFKKILDTDSKFANTDTIDLRRGVIARMKELDMLDKDGNILPSTVKQAEDLRQYINENWSPRANGAIRDLKNGLDIDVTSWAGEDLYKQARSLHSEKMSQLDNPKGISKILDSEGPINRAVSVEKVADTILGLPKDQLSHVVKVLRNMPEELQPQAQQAIAEIRAHVANKVLDAGSSRQGQWGSRDVTKFLKNNAAKLPELFTPEEMARFHDLNDAGIILMKDTSYPGAAIQEHNLVRRGAMAATRAGGAALGGFIGGPLGAAAGDIAGAGVARSIGEKGALKAAQKRIVKLSDFPK